MNLQSKISNAVIIFSKWSGKSYAIFASLKKVVKIARLNIDICNVSIMELKNKSVQRFKELIENYNFDDIEELEEYNFELLTLKSIVIDPKSPQNSFDLNFQNIKTESVLSICSTDFFI